MGEGVGKVLGATTEDLRAFFITAVTAVSSTNGGGRVLGADGLRYVAQVLVDAIFQGRAEESRECGADLDGEVNLPALKKGADRDLFARAYFRTAETIAGEMDLGLRATATAYRVLGGSAAEPGGLLLGWRPAVYETIARNIRAAAATLARVAELTRLVAGEVGAVNDIEETQNVYEFMLAVAPAEVRERVLLGRGALYVAPAAPLLGGTKWPVS